MDRKNIRTSELVRMMKVAARTSLPWSALCGRLTAYTGDTAFWELGLTGPGTLAPTKEAPGA